ncbi:MAG: hypothetical protein QOJ13_2121 [Gaiellales bacterium]|jgi:hypothetical protein|nr:hypothetical protein [Gaiellales bacterium]
MHRRARLGLRDVAIGATLIVACLGLSACGEVESATVSGYQPSKVQPEAGTESGVRVTFTQEGADRTGLETAPVRPSGTNSVVPYAAVIYDPQGLTYVYSRVAPLAFVRVQVVIERVDGNAVLLSKGPAVGTEVVTVGSIQVYGTELGIDGAH